jgi:hypothetical protein
MKTKTGLAIAIALGCSPAVSNAQVLWTETFDSAVLGPSVWENGTLEQGAEGDQVAGELTPSEADDRFLFLEYWTDKLPGWTVDDTGVWTSREANPGNQVLADGIGAEEWEGWSFTNKTLLATSVGDQRRAGFSLGTGNVAVADPDEWDDRQGPDGFGNPLRSPANNVGADGSADDKPYYDAFMTSPSISIAQAPQGALYLSFASSWRPEAFDDGDNTNNQTALVEASYDGGASWIVALKWDSDPTSPTFKGDTSGYSPALVTDTTNPLFGTYAENELVRVPLAHPAGASTVQLRFSLLDSGNDWWWAVDNLEVGIPEPASALLLSVALVGFSVRRRV